MRRKAHASFLRFETTWLFLTKYGAVGLVLGALIGIALGNVGIGITIGFITV